MPPKKRQNSGGGGAKAKAQKQLPGLPPDAMRMEHMKKFDEWVSLWL